MAPGFSIQNFRSDLNDRGVLRTTRGNIILPPPAGLGPSSTQKIAIRCSRFVLPPVWFSTEDGYRRYGYGPIDRIPETPLFDPIACEFIVDKRGEIYQFFYNWMTLITNFDSTSGMSTTNQFGAMPYEHSYRKDFIVDMDLLTYDEINQDVLHYKLNDAFPTTMQENTISWTEQDQFLTLSIQFAYRDWKLDVNGNNFLTDIGTFGINKLSDSASNFLNNNTNFLF